LRSSAYTGRSPTSESGMAKESVGAYSFEQFTVDWERKQGRCPQGEGSLPWRERRDPSRDPWFAARFRTQDHAACPTPPSCTRSPRQPRFFTLLPREQQEALQTARDTHATKAGQKR